jgi:AraC-like DNA-binding protein
VNGNAGDQTPLPDLSWLTQVKESRQPLSGLHPIWVRHGVVESGPTILHPERHPYCEFGLQLAGSGYQMAGAEKVWRHPGDLLLMGPNMPHHGKVVRYPLKFIIVYFLPSIILELDPDNVGLEILRRFLCHQPLRSRIVQPPRPLLNRLKRGFAEMATEFDARHFGREVKLRVLFENMIVDFIRWEQSSGKLALASDGTAAWSHVERALRYLHEHHAETIYARQLAQVAGVSESRLRGLFHDMLGMPWVKYLQGYRVHRAAAMLREPGTDILDSALAVGFRTLSHFNVAFREFMGTSPSRFLKSGAGRPTRNQSTSKKARPR